MIAVADCPIYNPFETDVLADPFPAYAEARRRCPVHYHADHNPGFFTAFTYADVQAITMQPQNWTARYGISPRFQRGVGFNTDGPEHLKFRKAVMASLGPRNLRAIEPEIETLAERLTDALIEHGPGDFHDLFAAPLPVEVIAKLLGIDGDLQRFKELSDALMAEGMNSDDPQEFNRILAELDQYWDEQLAPRRAALATVERPGPEHLGTLVPDDMMSNLLVTRTENDELLSEFEVSNTLMNLLLAGNETTISLLTNLVWRLLQVPERWNAVLQDRTLVAIAIEESLRFDAPVLGMFRTSVDDQELSETPIPAKSKVMAAYGAANRDPRVFADPDEFRLDRTPKELRAHLAFGRGQHACPGAALSRLEARIALNILLDRLPSLRLDGPSTRIAPFNFWGRRTLPIAW